MTAPETFPQAERRRRQYWRWHHPGTAELDRWRKAIRNGDNASHIPREAKIGRQTVYDFLMGAVPHPQTRNG